MKTIAAIVLACFATEARAQIINGDFSQGPAGWEVVEGSHVFPEAGTDGDFHVRGCSVCTYQISIAQTFECPASGSTLSLDYREEMGDITYMAAALEIAIDGEVKLTKAVRSEYVPSWKSFSIELPGGTHRLTISVTIYQGGQGWVDNVRLSGEVPVLPVTWSGIKTHYR